VPSRSEKKNPKKGEGRPSEKKPLYKTFFLQLVIFCTLLMAGIPLSFSSINCNSLNMSSTGKLNQSVKIYAITKLKTDIIFLSDIRLSNRNLISCSNEINKLFQLNPYGAYKFYFNSTKNKRGTGILIKNNLDVTVLDSIAEPDENFLIQRICVSGTNLTIGSIYGPNTLDLNFFERLKESLIQRGTDKVIIAGDWNCLYSNDPVNFNIDCLNMANVPNSRHSQQVKNICDELNLLTLTGFSFPIKKTTLTYQKLCVQETDHA
jgi:exonuclease III